MEQRHWWWIALAEIRRNIPGLPPATRHAIRVRAFSSFGVASDWSEALDIQTPGDSSVPNAPVNLDIDFDTPTLILAWERGNYNTDGSPLNDFRNFVVSLTVGAVTKTYETSQPFFIYSVTQNERDFSTPSPEIYVEITTVDVTGNTSAPLAGTAINSVPLKPLNPEFVPSIDMIVVTMQADPADKDIKDYTLERAVSGVGVFSVVSGQGGDTYVDQVGADDYIYRYRVRDHFNQLSPYSEEIIASATQLPVEDTTPPSPVTDLTLDDNGIDDITRRPYARFIWSPNNTDADLAYYEIRVVNTTTSVIQSAIKGPGASHHTFIELEQNTQYEAVLYLYDYSGNRSNTSNTVLFTTLIDNSAPSTPTGTGTIVGIESITVHWDPVTHIHLSHYEVYASQTLGFTPDESTFTNRTFVGNANRYLHMANEAETWYFRVRAINTNGVASPFTAEFSATAAGVAEDTTPPGDATFASGDLTATSYFHGSTEYAYIEGNWADVADAVGYVFSYRPTGALEWTESFVGSSYARVTGLDPTQAHEARIKAYKSNGALSTNWSATQTAAAPTTSTTALGQVTGLTATAGVGKVIFAWSELVADSLNDYHLQIATNSGFTTGVRDIYASTNEYHYTGVTGTTYYARVKGRNTFGVESSLWSASASGAVLAVGSGDLDVSIGGSNLVVNSSFESGTTDWFTNNGTVTADTTVKRSGAASGKFVVGNLAQTYAYLITDHMPFTSVGERVTGSIYVRRGAANTVTSIRLNVQFRMFDGTTTTYETDSSALVTIPSDGWTRLAITSRPTGAPTNVISVRLYPLLDNSPAAGDVWYFDDAQLEVGDVATAYAMKGSDLAADAEFIDQLHVTGLDASILNAGTAFVNDLNIESTLTVNTAGIVKSANFDAVNKVGYQLTNTGLEFYGGSIILGNTGLNINTTTDQLWFGAAAFADAKWRVDADGSMRVGVDNNKFNVDALGNLMIGGNTSAAPVYITNAGAATFGNVRLTGANMVSTDLIIDTTNFDVNAAGEVQAASITATGGTIGGVTIASTKLSGGIIEGTTFNIANSGSVNFTGSGHITWASGATGGIQLSNSGFINNAAYRTDANTGFQLSNTGIVINEGTVKAAALQIGVSSENLLKNSAFTEGTAVATDWTSSGAPTYSIASDAGGFLFFGKAQKMVATVTEDIGIKQLVAPQGGFAANDPVMASAWMKGTDATVRSARILIQNSTGTTLFTGNSFTLTADTWVRVVAQHRLTAAQAAGLTIVIQVLAATVGQTFYIDGAKVEKSDFVTDYTPRALEIPTNYINSAHISGLSADDIETGTLTSATVTIGSGGSIAGTNWSIDETGATFANGTVSIVGGNSAVIIDSSSLRAVYGGTTRFMVNNAGVYIGGTNSSNANMYMTDTGKTVFQSVTGTHKFIIDTTAPINDRVLRLTSDAALASADNFYLTNTGQAYFGGGIISGSDLQGSLSLAGDLTVGGHMQSTIFNATSGWYIDGNGDVTFSSGTFRGNVSIREGDAKNKVNLIPVDSVTDSAGTVETYATDGLKSVGSAYAEWASAVGDGTGGETTNYIQVDLGAVKDVSELRVYWWTPSNRYYRYRIKYSEDGTNWFYAVGDASTWVRSTQAASSPTGAEQPTIDRFNPRIAARYIRVYGEGNSVNTGNHIYEIEAFSGADINNALTVGQNFRVDKDGNLFAASGTFAGSLSAASGTLDIITVNNYITSSTYTTSSGWRVFSDGLARFYNIDAAGGTISGNLSVTGILDGGEIRGATFITSSGRAAVLRYDSYYAQGVVQFGPMVYGTNFSPDATIYSPADFTLEFITDTFIFNGVNFKVDSTGWVSSVGYKARPYVAIESTGSTYRNWRFSSHNSVASLRLYTEVSDGAGYGAAFQWRWGSTDEAFYMPYVDGGVFLGGALYRWKRVYAAESTINTSDARTKRDIGDADLGLNFILELTPKRWKRAADSRSGEPAGNRWHRGLIAQDVKSAMDRLGVDWAGYIDPMVKKHWSKEDEDDLPEGFTPPLGIAYDELWGPAIKAFHELNEEIAKKDKKIRKLEKTLSKVLERLDQAGI